MSHVLIVDDEESICWSLSRLLVDEGHDVTVACSAEQAISQSEKTAFDAVVLDVRLPGMDGLSAMQHLEQSLGPLPIVIMTAFGSLTTAVEAMRNGAFDYLPKPFDLEEAATVISRALARSSGVDSAASHPPHALRDAEGAIVGSSAAMQTVFKRVALVAPSEASVLITGESGTGKELIARAIHRHSARSHETFVPVNVASLSPSLVESELFGHVRGAYTGATSDRLGLVELAHKGTLFIDEISEIPLPIQVKLLRVLEEREVSAVGDNHPRQSDFRVIAATNEDLRQHVNEGRFREDLFFRLAVFEIEVPPLRYRTDDVPSLAHHFLKRADTLDKPGAKCGRRLWFASETLDELIERPWPGNVRELRNAVEHASLVAREGEIRPEHLPHASSFRESPAGNAVGQLEEAVRNWGRSRLGSTFHPDNLYEELLKTVEPPLLDVVLEETNRNRAAAAKLLGLHRATLRKKMS